MIKQHILSKLSLAAVGHPQPSSHPRQACPTRTIGVIIPEVENPLLVLAIDGIEAVARQNGYYVVICLTYGEESRQVANMQLLANGRVDGVLLHNATAISGELTDKALLKSRLPVVFFDAATETCRDRECRKSLAPPDATDQPAYAIGKEAAERLVHAMQKGAFQ